jgi:hypothetical protein
MASKKTNGSKTTAATDRRVLYARLPASVFRKLEKIAANRSVKRGGHVTLQDTVIALINDHARAEQR